MLTCQITGSLVPGILQRCPPISTCILTLKITLVSIFIPFQKLYYIFSFLLILKFFICLCFRCEKLKQWFLKLELFSTCILFALLLEHLTYYNSKTENIHFIYRERKSLLLQPQLQNRKQTCFPCAGNNFFSIQYFFSWWVRPLTL